MLTQDQIELIHREIDGENSPVDSAAFRSLVEREPQARALASDLRHLAGLLDKVPDRAPPPGLRAAIVNAIGPAARASPDDGARMTPRAIARWFVLQWSSLTTRMEETMLTKKGLIVGTTAVAAVALVGALVVGYPPSGGEVGTIGGADTIGVVEQASRYRGRSMSAADVSLSNPEIQTLFQNHQILSLVQSDVFRQAMRNDAFRELQANEAYRQLMANEAYRQLMLSDSYRQLMASEAYRQLMLNDAFRELQKNEAYRQLQAQDAFRQLQSSEAMRALQANEAYRQLQLNDSFRQLMASDAFRQLMASDAYRQLMLSEASRQLMFSDAYRQLMLNDAFRQLQFNDAFRQLMANDAFRQLQANETFRALSRNLAASEAFLAEAMRAQQ